MKEMYRKTLFIHLQGIVLIPILNALFSSKMIQNILNKKKFSLRDMNNEKHNVGYMNVALRNLSSANLFKITFKNNELDNEYQITQEFIELYQHKDIISKFNSLLSYHNKFIDLDDESLIEYNNTIDHCIDILIELKTKDFREKYFIERFEGVLLGPILNNLGFYNYLNNLNDNNFVLKNLNNRLRDTLETIFISSNLIHLENENYQITDKGKYFFNKCASYGVTCSYIPTFNNMYNILFGDCSFIWEKDSENNEKHVNRHMNVWGSGGAHKTYFKKIDNIIISLFNKPLEKQPKAILDVGCGDGTFLEHIYTIITEKTLRGKHIKEFPLGIIGIDINKAARIASRKKLNNANIDNIILNGSINNPNDINKSLANQFKINLSDCLNTRTFLDHNRIYSHPKKIIYKSIKSSGAFCYKGKLITNDEIINNLIEHFSKWAPYIKKFGLIVLELHTLNPEFTKKNQDATPAIAYDATHGFSDQYLVEHRVFEDCLKKSGISINTEHQTLFPNIENPTISINYIK